MRFSSNLLAFLACRPQARPPQQRQCQVWRSRALHQSRLSLTTTSSRGGSNVDNTNKHVNQTVPSVLAASVAQFTASNTPEPLHSAVQLLAQSLDLPWSTGFRDLMQLSSEVVGQHGAAQNDTMTRRTQQPTLEQRRLTNEEAIILYDLTKRRMKHEPLQYLAGQWDFLEFTLQVRAPLLCPRPETEELVQLVLDDWKSENKDKTCPTILDVGCGTGCIGIAIAKSIEGASVIAIDIEPVAIETATTNAATILGSEAVETRYQAQLVDVADFTIKEEGYKFDIVVSNPPYIPRDDMATLDPTVLKYESHTALVGGDDGMDIIRTLVHRLPHICRAGAVCWMEVDPSHPLLLQAWLKTTNSNVKFVGQYKDLYQRDRFVKLLVTAAPVAKK